MGGERRTTSVRIALGYWQIIAINEAATAHFPLKIKLSQADYGGAMSGGGGLDRSLCCHYMA